ncbi:helix-turn-helix domain-containing protein [Streptomyces aurantiacus]|uniref:Transcriptional regulator n=1 Tax=Streptomyces aurantiacus TaxID=47760 RepID=A0A7G1P2T0_9ACTN|nr:helix-turn-helix transcriptional regulator [Streptomyces aurantiacus]BCL30063.1 transcriptional regulator [Streptomyces aurantiacus]
MSGEGVDEAGWGTEPGDEMAPMIEVVGSLIRFHREAAGMRVADFGEAMGYGEDLIRKVERGARIPRAEFLGRADEVLGADGAIASMRRHVEQARYPKKLRQLAQMEERAAELLLYNNHHIHGLLQTQEYAEAVFGVRRPAHSQEALEQAVEARMARQSVFEREPAPELSFVQEQVTLERPVGGTIVLRRQLERLLEVAKLPHVALQVMPTAWWDHPGLNGPIELLKFEDGTAVGRSDGAFNGRPTSDPRQLRVLELRYGIIRAQALPPGESVAFIERALGEL